MIGDEDGSRFRFRERPTLFGPGGKPVVEPASASFFRWWLKFVCPQPKIIVKVDSV